jgi:RNA polymerase sigma-70 factor (ECF subfamily)
MRPADAELPFETLLEHAPFLRRLARALVRDEEAARDLVQDTWLAALRRPPRDGERARGWLARLAANRARDERRVAAHRAQRERDASRPEAQPPESRLLERVELARAVLAAVEALREPYRETLWLRFYEDLTPKDIARRQGVSVETVTTRLRRGKAELRERLGERERWLPGLAALAGLRGPGTAALTLPVGLAAVAVVALGLLLFGLLRGGEREAGGSALAQRAEVDDTERPDAASAEPAIATVAERTRVPAAASEDAASGSAPAPGTTLVTGTVRWERFERARVPVGAVRSIGGVPTHELLDQVWCREEDGAFELEVPGGGDVLLVAAANHRPVITEALRLPAGGEVEHDLIGRTAGTPLEGRVLGGDGRPLARAGVSAARPEIAAHGRASGLTVYKGGRCDFNVDATQAAADLLLEPFLLAFVDGAYHLASESTRADEDGRYRLVGLGPGEHVVNVRPERDERNVSCAVTLAHRARAQRVVVPDRAAQITWRERRVVLEVRDEDGPLDCVEVAVDWHDELVAGLAEGRARSDWPLRLTLGSHGRLAIAFDEQDDPALYLTRPGHAAGLVRLATAAPDAEGRIVALLPAEGSPAELRLRLDTGGTPPPRRVGVRLVPPDDADGSRGIVDREVTVERGAARLAGVPPGRYRLWLEFPGGAPFRALRDSIEVAEGETEVELELETAAAIELVLDRPLAEPWPQLTAERPGARSVTLSFGGATPTPGEPLRLEPALAPGNWTLVAWDRAERRRRWETPVALVLGEVSRVAVSLPPPD